MTNDGLPDPVELVAEVRAALRDAAPGPWGFCDMYGHCDAGQVVYQDGGSPSDADSSTMRVGDVPRHGDAACIVVLRNRAEALCRVIEEQAEELRRFRSGAEYEAEAFRRGDYR